ncbi:hypothetical protein BU26DRAFT_514694 [Trematosphaeria pertusa]|uniref:Aminoglycoside phosphotransferase domain-containing protein n=1 Tax=Trematosphaeria pertusa TaxID=390896 RepID=A0A6A6IXW2_9PLEO|nr:uncharacterized protein BU26DRAFT_514694 [Trematosphaeria pertusa]KAF2254867.1 hypothetical protein BU26DRAFT_514694 [Trematosphaeria pertusa]
MANRAELSTTTVAPLIGATLVRFPVPGRVIDCDEKLRQEVAVMRLVREKTKIPVPTVHAWGLLNDLGLGPFIIMDYIRDGESLGNLWQKAPEKRTLRTNISKRDLRIYNQTGFRLICDNFRYGNMIVNNASDLKIIALLITKPILWEAPDSLQFQRYMACLKLFLSELELEESRRTKGHNRLSNLMRKSLSDGRFWFHELVYSGFTAADNPAWKAICEMLPDISDLASSPRPELVLERDVEAARTRHCLCKAGPGKCRS